MKCFKAIKYIVAVLLAVILMIPAVTQVQAAEYKTGIYKINTQDSNLNIRSCPGTDYMKVGSVPKGTKVNVTFVSTTGWGKIVYGDAHGWISLSYCKYVGPAEETTAASIDSSKITYGISSSNLNWVEGCKQEFSRSSGLCTSCATGTILRRRQAAEGKEVTFTFGDTRSSCGGNPVPDSKGYYQSCNFYYTPASGWVHTDEETGEQTVYYTVKEETSTHARNREYIADLLDKHPEGIVIYVRYGNSGRHAIVLTDYTRHADGSLSFFAYDPANGTEGCKLEKTWIMTKFKSVNGFFANAMSIWYIKGDLTVDDSYFDHPEAQVYESYMTVKKKNTHAYSEPNTACETSVKLTKGSEIIVDYLYEDAEGTMWCITEDGLYIERSSLKISDGTVLKAAQEALEAEAVDAEAEAQIVEAPKATKATKTHEGTEAQVATAEKEISAEDVAPATEDSAGEPVESIITEDSTSNQTEEAVTD